MSSADLGSTSAGGWLYPPGGWLSPDGWLYPLAWVVIPPRVGGYTPHLHPRCRFSRRSRIWPQMWVLSANFSEYSPCSGHCTWLCVFSLQKWSEMEVRSCDTFLFWRCKRSRDLWLHAQGPPSCSHSNGKAWMSRPRAGFRTRTLKK